MFTDCLSLTTCFYNSILFDSLKNAREKFCMSEVYYPSREDFQKLEAAQNDLTALNALIQKFRGGAGSWVVVAFPKNMTQASPTLKKFLQDPQGKGFVIFENDKFGRLREEAFLAVKTKRHERSLAAPAKPAATEAATMTLPDDTPAHVGKTAGKKYHSGEHPARHGEDGAIHGKHPGTKGRKEKNNRELLNQWK